MVRRVGERRKLDPGIYRLSTDKHSSSVVDCRTFHPFYCLFSSDLIHRRSSSIEPILDPSCKKEGFPHCTLSRIEVPVHPGGGSERTCPLGQSGKDSRLWTQFHREAAHQSSDVLKRIVTDGLARNGSVVDINSQGPGGFTPLMVAIVAEKGPWRIRSYSGHAVRSDSSSGSEHSEHDFLLSSSSHSSPHLAMRRMGKREMPESRVAALITPETDVNLTNDQGQTALHLAVFHSRGDYVQVLLAAKADPNVQDIWGQSPLHVAIGAAAEGPFKVLLDHPKTNIELKSQGGITPLMMTVMMVNQYMVKALVQRNADIAATDSEGTKEGRDGNGRSENCCMHLYKLCKGRWEMVKRDGGCAWNVVGNVHFFSSLFRSHCCSLGGHAVKLSNCLCARGQTMSRMLQIAR